MNFSDGNYIVVRNPEIKVISSVVGVFSAIELTVLVAAIYCGIQVIRRKNRALPGCYESRGETLLTIAMSVSAMLDASAQIFRMFF